MANFSGPSWDGLIFHSIIGASIVGVMFDLIVKPNRSSIQIFQIREIADLVLYELVSFLYGTSEKKKAMIYSITNLTVNVGMMALMRRLQLISNIGSAVFASIIAIEMTCKWSDFSKYKN